jgi:FkbM family methyltransferase
MFGFLQRLFRKSPPERSYALNELDLKLLPYLDRRGGFFIEAGANDGVTQSNTLFFERHRGWRGLLIEPIPELAAKCRKNRPRSIVENCALLAAGDPRRELTMQFCNLMSLVKGAMHSEEADREHIEKGCAVQKIETYEVTVPARPLDDILAAHRIEQVDLFSLDVEGFELQVLQGLTQVRPRFLLVEARDRGAIEAHLAPHYEVAAELSHHDVLFHRRA